MQTGVSQDHFSGGEKYMGMKKGRTATFRPLPKNHTLGCVRRITPVAQLTPVIQPIAMVPYSDLDEPLMTYEEEQAEKQAASATAAASVQEKQGVKVAPIVRIVVCVLALAVYVAGNFFLSNFLALSGDTAAGSGLGMILSMFKSSNGIDLFDFLPKIFILAAAVCVITTIIASAVMIKKKTNIVVKIFALLASLFILVALLVQILLLKSAGIGLYIVTALCLVSLLTAFLVKSK